MVHPDTYVQPTKKGLGLFAKRRFRRGEILWIVDDFDLKIPLEQYLRIDKQQLHILNRYSYLDYKNRVIVPWDAGKYVNHSCAPNSTGLLEFDNASIALRDISAGEEIVEDYCCYFGHFETFNCLCGAPNCRGIVGNIDSYDPHLRLRLKDIEKEIRSIDQYLLGIQSDENVEFMKIINGKRRKSKINGHEYEVVVSANRKLII
jgi:hypothetical protein